MFVFIVLIFVFLKTNITENHLKLLIFSFVNCLIMSFTICLTGWGDANIFFPLLDSINNSSLVIIFTNSYISQLFSFLNLSLIEFLPSLPWAFMYFVPISLWYLWDWATMIGLHVSLFPIELWAPFCVPNTLRRIWYIIFAQNCLLRFGRKRTFEWEN